MIDQATIPIGPLVEITDSFDAEVREVVTEFFQVLLAQDFAFATIRTPSHKEASLASSSFVRLRILPTIRLRLALAFQRGNNPPPVRNYFEHAG